MERDMAGIFTYNDSQGNSYWDIDWFHYSISYN